MPIVGAIAPDHDERKAAKAGRLPVWRPLDEILEQSLRATPKWSPWSYELLAAAIDEQEERGDNISTTALTSPCPRSVVLERKEPYVVSMDDLWRAFRGTMVHYVLEDTARPDSIAEVRFFAPIVGDELISCKPDLVTADGTMWDYKNTAEVPRYDYPYAGHQEQLNFNRWIVNNAIKWEKDDEPYNLPFDVRTLEFEHLAIMYMDIDGPKPLECIKTIQVPTGPGARNPTKSKRVPDVWDDEKVMWGWKSYDGQDIPGIVDRYKAMRVALDMYPEWPEGIEEIWGGPKGWGCPGFPYCPLKGKCIASRYPNALIW